MRNVLCDKRIQDKRISYKTIRYKMLHYEKNNPFLWLYDKLFPLPAVCPICMKQQNKLQVCESCRMAALRVRSLHGQCQKCHSFGICSDGCSNCSAWPGYLAGNRSIWLYRDAWREVIRDFKFRNKPWLADALAGELLPYIPSGYDSYLKRIYGDYKTRTLVEDKMADDEHVIINAAVVDPNRPYTFYMNAN